MKRCRSLFFAAATAIATCLSPASVGAAEADCVPQTLLDVARIEGSKTDALVKIGRVSTSEPAVWP